MGKRYIKLDGKDYELEVFIKIVEELGNSDIEIDSSIESYFIRNDIALKTNNGGCVKGCNYNEFRDLFMSRVYA